MRDKRKSEKLVVAEKDRSDSAMKNKIKTGTIVNCDRLNVREKPTIDSEIVCVLDALTRVAIDDSKSTDDFYKISVNTSVEGFCMKNFIAVL